jgi:multiple sugar transport system permease protein
MGTIMRAQARYPLLFLLPSIALLLFLTIYPVAEAIDLSVHDRNLYFPGRFDFIGAGNFVRLLSDNDFLHAVSVSFAYSAANVMFSISIGLFLAVFIDEFVKGKLRGLMTFCFVIPFAISRVASSFMWKLMYNPLIGIFNYVTTSIGLGIVSFLTEPTLAFFSVVAVDVWQWTFFLAVLFLSSIQLLPREPFEAARLDGAGRLRIFRHVTFPSIRSQLIFIIFIRWIESLRSFDLIYNMTHGGPGTATETLDMYAYRVGIASGGQVSYAASMSLVMLVLTIVIMTVVSRKWLSQ